MNPKGELAEKGSKKKLSRIVTTPSKQEIDPKGHQKAHKKHSSKRPAELCEDNANNKHQKTDFNIMSENVNSGSSVSPRPQQN